VEAIGYVYGESSPTTILATLNPTSIVRLYDYVAFELEEVPPGEDGPRRVRVIGQIVAIERTPFRGRRDLSTYEVMRDLDGRGVIEVMLARIRVIGYPWRGEIRSPRTAPRIGQPIYLARDEEVAEVVGVGELCIGHLSARPSVKACLNLGGVRRHVAIIAATGSGKTWTSVLLIEELLRRGAPIIVLDPHGEYVPAARTAHRLGDVGGLVIKLSPRHEGDVMYRIPLVRTDPDVVASAAGVPPNARVMRLAIAHAHSLLRALARHGAKPGIKHLVWLLREAVEGDPSLASIARELGVDASIRDRAAEKALKALKGLAEGRRGEAVAMAARYVERLARTKLFSGRGTRLVSLVEPGRLIVINMAGVSEEVADFAAYDILTRIFRARVRAVRGLGGPRLEWPVVVVVEEAHRFAPPKTQRRSWAREAVVRILSEGRKFGVYAILITQRPSRIDQDVLSQAQSQIVLRVVNPSDQRALAEAAEQLAEEYLSNLPSLDVGEAIVTGPITRVPTVIRLRDRVLDYGGGDIDLASAWGAKPGVKWPFRQSPTRYAARAAGLRVEAVEEVGGEVMVRIVEPSGDTVYVSLGDKPYCTIHGEGPCEHIYKALEHVQGIGEKGIYS